MGVSISLIRFILLLAHILYMLIRIGATLISFQCNMSSICLVSNFLTVQGLILDMEHCLTKQSFPSLVRLIGQSVFLYNPQLSLCLPRVSNQRS